MFSHVFQNYINKIKILLYYIFPFYTITFIFLFWTFYYYNTCHYTMTYIICVCVCVWILLYVFCIYKHIYYTNSVKRFQCISFWSLLSIIHFLIINKNSFIIWKKKCEKIIQSVSSILDMPSFTAVIKSEDEFELHKFP